MRDDGGEEGVRRAAQRIDDGGLAFQITDPLDPVASEDLEAAHVDPGEEHHRIARVHSDDVGPDEVQAHVGLACGESYRDCPGRHLDVRDVGEALGPQQIVGDVLRRPADAGRPEQSEPRGLRRGLGGDG